MLVFTRFCSQTYLLTKHTFKTPSFFEIDKNCNDYIINHKKNYDLFLNKYDFKISFNKDFSKPIHIETDFYHNTTFINLKRFLLYSIESFMEKGHTFSHMVGMNISTSNDKRYMTYDYYLQHPM